ncbi:MAG: hypothetical protein IPP48_06035 [Chitinophagaceae bacterium]|nr:hypothetical protein [Chitinophagaceae bacterium]
MDANGSFSSKKLNAWMYSDLLMLQIDFIYDSILPVIYSKKELKEFRALKFEIANKFIDVNYENKKISFKHSFFNEQIIDYFNTINGANKISNLEYLYSIINIDEIDIFKQLESLIPNAATTIDLINVDEAYRINVLSFKFTLVNTFILLHEFYHHLNMYDKDPILCETNADNYAISKIFEIYKYINPSKFIDSYAMNAIMMKQIDLKRVSKSKLNCFQYEKFINNIDVNKFSALSILGEYFTPLIFKNTIRIYTKSDRAKIAFYRIRNFYKIEKLINKCDSNSRCINCCVLEKDDEGILFFEEETQKFSKAISQIDSFKIKDYHYLNPVNPAFAAMSLGNYFLSIKDYSKAIFHYKNSDILGYDKITTSTVISFLILSDLYLYKNELRDIEKSKVYLEKAKKYNNIFRDFDKAFFAKKSEDIENFVQHSVWLYGGQKE